MLPVLGRLVPRGDSKSTLVELQRPVNTTTVIHEDAQPTCETDWKVCASNSDLVENNPDWLWKVTRDCRIAADEAAKYGEPKWSWVPFGKYLRGTDYPKTGIVTAIDEDVRFQNGFGTYGRSRVVCVYDLNTRRVVNLSVDRL
jgi:hypothetical protein